ncbi:hypothetical protein QNE54_000987 [Vibrio fluvialis]|nr:hypothetical protein [Vibrio fluvialis]
MDKNQLKQIHTQIRTQLKALEESTDSNYAERLDELLATWASLGSYSRSKWSYAEVDAWEQACTKIGQLDHADDILYEAKGRIDDRSHETAHFFWTEIEWEVKRDIRLVEENTASLIQRFPHNHWFISYYCNFATSIDYKGSSNEKIESYYISTINHLKTLDKVAENAVFMILRNGVSLFYRYLSSKNYDGAERLLNTIEKSELFDTTLNTYSEMQSLKHTLAQAKSDKALIDSTYAKVSKKVEDVSSNANKKSFEQLVIFTAIITFVVTAAGSAVKSPLPLWEIVGLGMTLLVFVLAIMMCLDKPQVLLKDFRFYILMAAFGLTAVLAITTIIAERPTINNYYTTEATNKVELAPKQQQRATENN